MAKTKTMRCILSAIALCAVLQPALAEAPVAARSTGAPAPAVVQTALASAAAAPPATGAPVVVASLKHDPSLPAAASAQGEQDDGDAPTTTAMLLTALALMTGIALRRWGSGQP